MYRLFYTWFFYLLLPAVLLRLLVRARKAPAYRQRWLERLGFFQAPPGVRGGIWVHAVSVGETIAAAPLIRRLQAEHPGVPITLTTMTPTGSERVRALFGESVFHVYAPWDFPGALHRFLDRVQPRQLIIMETELWPNMVYHCHLRGIPVVLANARLSEKSAGGYARVGRLTREMLVCLERVAVQTADEAERFVALGLPRRRCEITGSIKFDLDVPAELAVTAGQLRATWGEDRPVLVAASTHEGEDELVLEAFRTLREKHPDLLLILVPRHPERFDRVDGLCQRAGFKVTRRGRGQTASRATQVYLGDTMGDLMLLFGASDVAFVGGSLVDHGGHNVLEPAALGVPVVTGTSHFNFLEITRALESAGGLLTVQNERGLANSVSMLLEDEVQRREMGQAGQALVENNRGALDRLVGIASELLSR